MSRKVQLVILCEDTQHEAFIRRFLRETGFSTNRLRVEKAPDGRGSGAQFVRKRFPRELRTFREKRHIAQALIVMIDGDAKGLHARLKALGDACARHGVDMRHDDESVAVFVPTWCIETWFAYLDGETVDETRNNYPRLSRERDCKRHVDTLARMCKSGQLRDPAPPSLQAACSEFTERLAPLGR